MKDYALKKVIEHAGIVVVAEDKTLKVRITVNSACGACHARQACVLSETKEQIIEVEKPRHGCFKPGDPVILLLDESSGAKALFLGYLLPFMIVLLSLMLMFLLTKNEVLAAGIAISILAPYYYIIYLNKKKMGRMFRFRLKDS